MELRVIVVLSDYPCETSDKKCTVRAWANVLFLVVDGPTTYRLDVFFCLDYRVDST